MPIKRVNSTGRKKILREDAQISVETDGYGALTFHASLRLSDYELPTDAQVFVEAHRQTTMMRFYHGNVVAPQPPQGTLRQLTEFSTMDALLFRVKVTSAGERPGILLAEASRIQPSDYELELDRRIPLLPVKPEDLGQEIWRVDFRGADGPLLLISSRLNDWNSVAATSLFRGLVYPAAMREILWYLHKVEETSSMDDLEDWGCRWFQFASSGPGVTQPPFDSNDDGDWDDWINDAVASFASRHRMLDGCKEILDGEIG